MIQAGMEVPESVRKFNILCKGGGQVLSYVSQVERSGRTEEGGWC